MLVMPDTITSPAAEKPPHPQFRRLMIAAYELQKLVSQAEIGRLIHASDQTMTNWKARGLPDKEIMRLSRVMGCSPFWLEDGEGDMELAVPGVSKEALEIARAYDNLSAEKRAAYRVLLNKDDEHGDGATPPLATETERKRYSK